MPEQLSLLDGIVESSAVISPCGLYRYLLTRRWQGGIGLVCWVLLNPSTADGTLNDPTVRRLIGYSRAWGFSGFTVVNLFAFRATDPRAMKATPDAIGPENDRYIEEAASASNLVVGGWGRYGSGARATVVEEALAQLDRAPHALRLTQAGDPQHPLYLAGSLRPRPLTELRTEASAALTTVERSEG